LNPFAVSQPLSQAHSPRVILHDALLGEWLEFSHPLQILQADQIAAIPALLAELEQARRDGLYAAGWFSYEAATAFDPAWQTQSPDGFPLAWFGLYHSPQVISLPAAPPGLPALDWQPSVSRDCYREAIAAIKCAIAQGDTYQVNYTFRLRSPFPGVPYDYFLQIQQAQSGCYGAFIETEDWAICSASPELFFQQQGDRITCRPMKGTLARGLTGPEDELMAQALRQSAKNRAENVMIVDMIRNDLGQVATTGSVRVEELFAVERYPTLWQMTSRIEADCPVPLTQLLRSLYPCASITGAPKANTMQLIRALEDSPRRIYTGSLGFIAPDKGESLAGAFKEHAGRSQFNVAIRTVLVDKAQQIAEYGVGGGIVWDSQEAEEYEECCTKAKVLTLQQPQFDLLETLLWTPKTGYFLQELHWQRLAASAQYFGYALDIPALDQQLAYLVEKFDQQVQRVRVLCEKKGGVTLYPTPLEVEITRNLGIPPDQDLERLSQIQPVRLAIAPTPVHSQDRFLYHKTTHREVYDQARRQIRLPAEDWDDVLLWNERGELTETCIANVVVMRQSQDGRCQWLTPPVSAGLLAGTYRAWLLAQGLLREQTLRLEELRLGELYLENKQRGDRLYVINSVRLMRPAVLVGPQRRSS
jgi:para-aminobenzoate synthetase / 4-amino-4-deoxychorismate lyase